MLKLPPDFRSNPKFFAYSGFWAIVPKLGLSALLALPVAICARQISAFLSFLIFFYPFVALILDVLLYAFRNRFWQSLPTNVLIPEDWKISPAELEQYAKVLPKARLMRVLTSPLLMLVFIQKWYLLMAFVGFAFFFFIGVLFDSWWLSFFKVKTPKLFEEKKENH